ncbi:hypothetical protein [Halococcus sp. AFM35]|uniref:hypothetical protein n=1 Tax=Halococcus sp. AFM35 TaxID=3421653 RepID=UPI003EBEAC00
MPAPTVSDHYSPTKIDYPAGTYRVVGTDDEAVTLLKVGDSDGQRVTTGEIVTVSCEDFVGFEPAENPDRTRRLVDSVRSSLEVVYWSFRVFGQELIAHSLLTLVAVAVILVGNFGEAIVPLPDTIYSFLVIIGALGLAYIGSGRL